MRNYDVEVGDHEMGHCLIEFCKENKLVVANTAFKHHNRRRYTWVSPDENTRNQVKYLITHQRWKSNISNCCTYLDANCNMNHQLLIWKIRLRVQNEPRLNLPRRFDVDEIPQACRVQIESRVEVLG